MMTIVRVLTLVALCSLFASAQDAKAPSISPISGKTVEDVARSYGKVMHPVLKVERQHNGVDIPAPVGSKVVSTADGVISRIGENGAEGRFLQVTHSDGFATRYTHLSKILVKEGQKVKQGARIALSGNTGMSSRSHLHYEVLKNGEHLNPEQFLAAK